MNEYTQDQVARNIGPSQPPLPDGSPGGTPTPSPRPEIPHESPPMEIPAKPERELPMPVPERAHGARSFAARWLAARLLPLALGVASLFLLQGCALIEGIFKAGVGVGALVVIAIVAVIGGIFAMLTRK
jgi:hypothetical protein